MDRMEIIGYIIRAGMAIGFSYLALRWTINAIDPTNQQKKEAKKAAKRLLQGMGVKDVEDFSEYELMIAQHLVAPSHGVQWSDIGGCEDIIQDLVDTLIVPLKLTRTSSLLVPPKGVLLYGPPGCGKTLLAKAVARSADARFIDLQFSTLTDKWYGESQKLAAAVFSAAQKLQPTIIFIDEIDSFLRNRASHDHEATAMMKAQFLSLWDGFQSDPQSQVVIMGATNRPQDVDPAILRRMPLRFHIALPNCDQRVSILQVILKNEPLDADVDLRAVAAKAKRFSGSDLRETCRLAAVSRMRTVLSNKVSAPNQEEGFGCLTQADLLVAVSKYTLTKTLEQWSHDQGTGGIDLD